MAYMVMAYIVMTYIVMTYIVMAVYSLWQCHEGGLSEERRVVGLDDHDLDKVTDAPHPVPGQHLTY